MKLKQVMGLVLTAVTAVSLTGCQGNNKTITIGASNFTEVNILGNIYKELIETNTDIEVKTSFGLSGAAICFAALEKGDIDMFVEYTGTALSNLLEQPLDTDPERVYDTVVKLMAEEHGIHTSKPLGFNNTYVMSVKPETAEKYGLVTLSDMIEKSGELRLGCTVEFVDRQDCLPLLEAEHNVKFGEVNGLDASIRYTAVDSGKVDVVDAFSTDALLYKLGLVTLTDDLNFFPPYYACNFVSEKTLESYPELRDVLAKLDGTIDEKTMADMNSQVDIDGKSAEEVAHKFLLDKGLVSE